MEKAIIPPSFVNKPENYPQNLSPAEVRKRFLKLLGKFKNPSVPLDLQVTGEETLAGDIVCQHVAYAVAPDERVAALHLFKKGLAAKAPGVLAIHGHGGEDIFPIGKAAYCKPEADNPSQYGYHAALAGFRVLAPDALCFGERMTNRNYSKFFMDEVLAQAELTARGKSFLWKSVWDNSRAIEALEELGARKIGSIGHSGGSTQNYVLAAVNPKIRAAVCTFSFATLRHQFYQYRLCHCLYHYVPGMVSAGIDWDQVVALTAPRKSFFGWGGLDEGSPEVMYRAFVEAIRQRCARENLPDSVVVHEDPNIGHKITAPMLAQALAFLWENLK